MGMFDEDSTEDIDEDVHTKASMERISVKVAGFRRLLFRGIPLVPFSLGSPRCPKSWSVGRCLVFNRVSTASI